MRVMTVCARTQESQQLTDFLQTSSLEEAQPASSWLHDLLKVAISALQS